MYHFRRIGDILGTFLEADLSFVETKEKKVARILVNINLREGLAESINLDWGLVIIPQILDYENVPFRCRRCHVYGHPVSECTLPGRFVNGSTRKGYGIERKGPSQKIEASSGTTQTSADELGSDPSSEELIFPNVMVDEGIRDSPAQVSPPLLGLAPGDHSCPGTPTLPLLSNVNLFLNNVSFLGYDWIEGLRKLPLSGQNGIPLSIPVHHVTADVVPGVGTHAALDTTAFDPDPLPVMLISPL